MLGEIRCRVVVSCAFNTSDSSRLTHMRIMIGALKKKVRRAKAPDPKPLPPLEALAQKRPTVSAFSRLRIGSAATLLL